MQNKYIVEQAAPAADIGLVDCRLVLEVVLDQRRGLEHLIQRSLDAKPAGNYRTLLAQCEIGSSSSVIVNCQQLGDASAGPPAVLVGFAAWVGDRPLGIVTVAGDRRLEAPVLVAGDADELVLVLLVLRDKHQPLRHCSNPTAESISGATQDTSSRKM